MAENPIYMPPPNIVGSADYMATRERAAREELARRRREREEREGQSTEEGAGQLGGIIASLAALATQNYAAIPAAYHAGEMGGRALAKGAQGDAHGALRQGMGAALHSQSLYDKYKKGRANGV